LYTGKVKTDESRNSIPIPEAIRPVIEAWRKVCKDTSPEALMFSTSGRKRKKVPRQPKNFLTWRIHPIAIKLGIPKELVTFQVMRRTLGTDLQLHGTMKDAQRILRHASIRTTANVYMQPIPASVMSAINSRTRAILGDWEPKLAKVQHTTVPNWVELILQVLEELAPQVGLEPTTLRLTAGCSAIELLRSGQISRRGRGGRLNYVSFKIACIWRV
jgi:hypothetical protein